MKDYIDIDNVNNFTCETCDISKVTRKTHHSIDISQSSQILELLHADLCGPINIESYGGAKYLMGSKYLGEIENETWDIDSFFEVSPERNEINQNTETGVLSNFDINNASVEIENDN
ncbi:retrovirus-related Pol polyprotein from transposon TNT 1-94 [Trichonephila clavipes]|nr:retrovirus-related Pol polyprotein from transposon TNT 1-94 [Trichonephila clavipes]